MRQLSEEQRGRLAVGTGERGNRVLALRPLARRSDRAHGISNMPDPEPDGHLDIGPGTDVDVRSPQFQAAYQVCKSKLTP